MLRLSSQSFVKNLKPYQTDVDVDLQQRSAILPSTAPYQLRTIKWMVHKEKYNHMVKSDGSPFTGGILSDETNMGKIIEIMSCILENPASYEFCHQQHIDISNKRAVSDVSRETIVKCPCIEMPTDGTLVFCAICGNGQHAECVRFKDNSDQIITYLCDDCWSVNGRFQCKATLIVVPHSTLNEWTDETNMAKLGLKTFIYHGVRYDGYIQPMYFKNYDVIITTYDYLQMEFIYMRKVEITNETTNVRLRYEKKYNGSQSPLKFIKWWRICFDSGQTIECTSSSMSKITSRLESIHKWVINGTSIKSSVNDLFDIIKFLDIKPYCDHNEFLVLIKGDKNHMYNWFANVIWHNFLDDVNMELNIPELTKEEHWLTYSSLEKRFYPNTFNHIVKRICVNATKPCQRLNTPLKYVNWKKLSTIMIPIVRLQKGCVHPQDIQGNFKKLKKLSVKGILDEMILEHHNNMIKLLRCVFLQHNIIAGQYFNSSPFMAMDHYHSVLQLANVHRSDISDIHQPMIFHALNNINILVNRNIHLFRVTSSQSFGNELRQRIDEYLLSVDIDIIENIRSNNAQYTCRIHMLMKGKLFSTDWYNNMFELIAIPRHFFYELQLELADYCVNGVTNIAKKLETKQDICKIIQKWLSVLENRRNRVFHLFSKLNKWTVNELYASSSRCCVRYQEYYRRHPQYPRCMQTCILCKTETSLKEYEVVLFNYSYIGTTEDTIWSNNYEKSQEELLLSKLFNYGEGKITDPTWLVNATNHMNALSLLRTEFKGLKELWCQQNETNYRYTSVQMSKKRLVLGMEIYQLKEIIEPRIRLYGQDVDVTIDNRLFQTCLYALPTNIEILKSENLNCREDLDNEIRAMTFLKHVKNENMNVYGNDCFICSFNVVCGWAVLPCGHKACANCIDTLTKYDDLTKQRYIMCPFCKETYEIQDETISFTENQEEAQVYGVTFKGNFSIKIESITLKLMELIAENPNVKVLILSFWDKALDVLGETLDLNAINFIKMKTGCKFHAMLNEFKADSTINALLMTLDLTSKEFHLTEATRVFFMEPVINKAYEINAIGKIRRIGQTKPTFVHHFIIQDTIEEKITNVFSKRLLHDWDDVTVSELATILME